jgi:hypothetical protein
MLVSSECWRLETTEPPHLSNADQVPYRHAEAGLAARPGVVETGR